MIHCTPVAADASRRNPPPENNDVNVLAAAILSLWRLASP